MELQFGASTYVRQEGNFPYLPVINMYAEETPTEGTVSLISRTGLEYSSDILSEYPVHALFQQDGVLNGEYFSIIGSKVYKDTSIVGSISGSGSASIAAYQNLVFFNRGAAVTVYDGASYASVPFPDDANVLKIVVGSSRLLGIRKDTQRFYWSDVLSTNIDDLSFASAENSPDTLLDMLYIGDKAYLFGSDTVEIWPVTTDPDIPFKPLQGSTFQVGIKNTGAVTKLDTSFAWVTDTNQICFGTPEKLISFPGLEEKLAKETNVRLWNFFMRGSEFLALELPSETWVFKVSSQSWAIFQTYGFDRWVASCHAGNRFGSKFSGGFLSLTDEYTELSQPFIRICRAWSEISSDPVFVNNLIVRGNSGHTPFLEGPYTNPKIELKSSRDGGNRWTDWRPRALGINGEYRRQVYWNGLGAFTFPGMMIELRVSDPVPFRISKILANEKVGGS